MSTYEMKNNAIKCNSFGGAIIGRIEKYDIRELRIQA